jgi:hypothetical protein
VVSNEFIKKSHDATQRDTYINTFNPELERLASAHQTGVWNAVTGPLCGWCPVTSCEHYRRR